jgi:hypothetical protein
VICQRIVYLQISVIRLCNAEKSCLWVGGDSSSKSENKQKTAEDSTGRSLSSAMLRDTVSLAIGNANTIIIGVGVH